VWWPARRRRSAEAPEQAPDFGTLDEEAWGGPYWLG